MAYLPQLFYIPMTSISATTLTGASYQIIGVPLPNPCSLIKIVNNSTVDVSISTDGLTDMDIVPTGGFTLYDATANLPHSSDATLFPKNTQFFVKGVAGTGSIYLVGLYIKQV